MNQINIDEDLLNAVTGREREIITDMADGLTSRQSGRRRSISRRTVEVHRHNIFKKTGLSKATEVVAAFIRGGII